EKRSQRYHQVRTLAEQGFGLRAIARQLKISRETIRKYLQAEDVPVIHHFKRGERGSILSPYKPYLLQRWKEGCRNSVQLYDEIKARGFIGSAPLLRIFLADLRKKHREAGSAETATLDPSGQILTVPEDLSPRQKVIRRMSPITASWLFMNQEAKRTERQKEQIELICAAHPDLKMAYQIGQQFVMMLAERRYLDLDAWLALAEQSSLPEFKRFAHGIRRDYAAVKAAFSSEVSNGQVEGQVQRLKVQKRQVYGRANFDLLRLRVLHRA
ncbi:MAG TPA: transposase, partial [Ktedonobacteraceae bacterium]|nr:transposase [Ktedonobacteraceae bacterium]